MTHLVNTPENETSPPAANSFILRAFRAAQTFFKMRFFSSNSATPFVSLRSCSFSERCKYTSWLLAWRFVLPGKCNFPYQSGQFKTGFMIYRPKNRTKESENTLIITQQNFGKTTPVFLELGKTMLVEAKFQEPKAYNGRYKVMSCLARLCL